MEREVDAEHAHACMVHTFEVQCKRFKGFRSVGVARIAVSDFLGGGVSGNFMHVELPVEGLGRERKRGGSFRGEGGGGAGEGDGGQ